MFYNRFPYTDLQQKNLDWMIQTIKDGETAVENKIAEADTAIENAEAATEAANTAKTGADDAATAANNAATAANNAKDAADTAAAHAEETAVKYGTPYATTTAASMTDHTKIYVYTGSEVGYTAGNWYYWNGTAWTSGGAYIPGSFQVAGTYSDSATYNVGDYVIYGGYLYRCITAITTAEAWTAAHWTQVLLGNDVTEIRNDYLTDKEFINFEEELANRNYRMECIFHDNFHRDVTPGEIGTNGIDSFPMTYTPSDDCAFYIDEDYILKNDTSKTGLFLFLDCNYRKNFCVVLSAPDNEIRYHITFCYNYLDGRNRSRIDFAYTPSTNGVGVTRRRTINNVHTTDTLTDINTGTAGFKKTGNAYKLYFMGNSVYVYLNDTYVGKFDNEIINTNLKIGLEIANNSTYSYIVKSILVYNIEPNYFRSDEGKLVDIGDYYVDAGTGKKITTCALQAPSGDLEDCVLERNSEITKKSPYSEKLSLIYNENGTAYRSEMEFRAKTNTSIANAHLSFDVYFPSDYVADPEVEVIAQFHATPNDDGIGYRPPVCLRTISYDGVNTLEVRQWGTPFQDDTTPTYSLETPILDIETERWYHIDIYCKFGYMDEMCPETIVYIDGELVYKNYNINMANTARGLDIHYGIYKRLWETDGATAGITQRTVYFDNVVLKRY